MTKKKKKAAPTWQHNVARLREMVDDLDQQLHGIRAALTSQQVAIRAYAQMTEQVNTKHVRLIERLDAIVGLQDVWDTEHRELIATQRSRIDNLENELRAAIQRAAMRAIDQNEDRDLMKLHFRHDIDVLNSRCSASVVSHALLWIFGIANIALAWFYILKPY